MPRSPVYQLAQCGGRPLIRGQQGQLRQQRLDLGVLRDRLADGMPLGVIAVEQARRRPAVDLGGELPAQVHRVLEAGVQALAGRREVDMGGVARQQDAPGAVTGREAGGVAEPRQPAGPRHPAVGSADPQQGGPELVERQRLGGRCPHPLWIEENDPGEAARPARCRIIRVRVLRLQRYGQDAVGPRAVEGRRVDGREIAQRAAQRLVGTGKADPGGPPHHAPPAVAPDHIPCAYGLHGAAGPADVHLDTARAGAPVVPVAPVGSGFLAQPDDLVSAPDRDIQLPRALLQQLLGAGLGEEQRVAVPGVQRAEVQGGVQPREVPPRYGASAGQEPFHQAPLVHQLDAARMQCQRP